VLGEFIGVGMPRPDPDAARGHACVMRHSWRLLPQSVAHGTYRLMGVLVGVGEVCARWRLAGEATVPVRPTRDFVKCEFE